MRIQGFQPHIARAYGVQPPRQAAPVTPTSSPQSISGTPGADRAAQIPDGLRALIAGRAPGGVDFNQSAPVQQLNPAVLPMYTRAADKIEAATAIQLGQSLDLHA